MAKYRVLERSFIANRLLEPGAVVEHDFSDGGTHGPNLEPIGDVIVKKGRKAKDAPPATDPADDSQTGADDLT
jgi:hypothetical protein